MQIIIVSTNNVLEEEYWQKRLADHNAIVIHEDWPGGAGNGLGTLYAFQKARQKGMALYNFDIIEKQKEGSSIALYHAAGYGKRLSPLPLSENLNKSAVKLPTPQPLTILEAVIKQTATFFPLLKGRLSVFWGDQIFFPKHEIAPSNCPIDIFVIRRPIPSQQEWTKKGL